nr:hypothetical protein [Candidatus Sumerlaeota bacterium]
IRIMKKPFLIIWFCVGSFVFGETTSVIFEMTNGKQIEIIQANLDQDKFAVQCVAGTEITIPIPSVKSIYLKPNTEDSPKEKSLKDDILNLKKDIEKSTKELEKLKEHNNQLLFRNNLLQTEIKNLETSLAKIREDMNNKTSMLKYTNETLQTKEEEMSKLSQKISELESINDALAQETGKFQTGQIAHAGKMVCAAVKVEWKNLISDGLLKYVAEEKFLVIGIAIMNKGLTPDQLPRFSLIDEAGAEYVGEYIPIRTNLLMSLGVINPNVMRKGLLIFDVPPTRKYSLKITSHDFLNTATIDLNISNTRGTSIPRTKVKSKDSD